MKQKFYSLFLIALLGIWGMQTWAQELSTTEIDGVTYYEIGSATDLVAFADLVNNSNSGANAVLTADIDLTNATATGNWPTPIGYNGVQYTGVFDGQGHAITNFEYEAVGDFNGLFGLVKDANIKNFSISGTLTIESYAYNGTIGCAQGSTVISGIYSSLNINITNCHAHSGGILGSTYGSGNPVIVENCEYSGTLTHTGDGDCQGGILGYTYNGGVRNCIFSGTIIGEINKYGGILGYCKVPGFGGVQNCLSIGKIIADEGCTTAAAIIGNWNGDKTANVSNNYYCLQEGSTTTIAIGNKGANCEAPVLVTPEQLASGEVCYMINSKLPSITFYQTLPDDKRPVLDATHGTVYLSGHLHCDGTTYEGSTYSNDNSGTIQDEHDFVDGFCTYCNTIDESYLTQNADGYYELSTAKQLVWFEQMVNKGNPELNAVVTADIDFEELGEDATWVPIGDWGQSRGIASLGYKGHFNGQGHKLTNFNFTAGQTYFALVGVASDNCLIENFEISGNVTTQYQYAGSAVGYARDNNVTIRNIRSTLNINNSYAGGRQGGIVGGSMNGTVVIDGCIYSGTLKIAELTGNYGGIVGYVNNNASAVVTISNCLFDGELNNGTAGGQCGGIIGYNNGGTATIKNCLSIGTVSAADGLYGQIFGTLNGNNSTCSGVNFYQGEILNGTNGSGKLKGTVPVEVTSDQLANGEICWKLNNETFIDPIWRQDLDEDSYPKPMAYGAIVYQTLNGYECISPDDSDSFITFRDGIITAETAFIQDDELMAYQPLIDEYEQAIKSWESISNYNDFIEAYKASFEIKENIQKSAKSYAAYVKACQSAAAELEGNELEGYWATLLSTYLDESQIIEPNSETYPNGNYTYIIDKCNLDDAALDEEIAFVNQMLENAIAGGITEGTEITRLLANPTFADGFNGWTTEANGPALASGGDKEIMPVVRGLGNGTFSASQTLNELPNGIYVMTVNGLFRAGTDITSTFYAGQLYLNNTANYFMSPSEDYISLADAVPGENCLGEGTDAEYTVDGEVLGYVPNSLAACPVAFSAGRYQNFCATKVTDGTLTVGVRSLGTGLASDWLPFGNLHVWYLGTAEQAEKKLDEVLTAFGERAETIVNFENATDYEFENYPLKPNMSNELKGRLEEAIDGIAEAQAGEEKMALINTFSALFAEVHACRMAYIAMTNAATEMMNIIGDLSSAELISDEEYYDWEDEVYATMDHFEEGDVSAEEALRIAEKLKNPSFNFGLPTVDGVMQLASVDDLKTFSGIVRKGYSVAKAALTADIDLSVLTKEDYDAENGFLPIGGNYTTEAEKAKPFQGVFDGQGYKISNFGLYQDVDPVAENTTIKKIEMTASGSGLFGFVKNATIKNFSIDGAFSFKEGTGAGAIGWAESTTVSNVHSSLDIAVPSTAHHIAGVCGSLRSSSKAYNCSFSGTISTDPNTHDCIGGIGGYSNGGCFYENCVNYGTITFAKASAYAGGIFGYINDNSFAGIKNCLNVGEVKITSGEPQYSGAIVGRVRSHPVAAFANNYWLEGTVKQAYGEATDITETATAVNAEQLESGEICYKLNANQPTSNWFQTLNVDPYPVLFPTSAVIFYNATEDFYYNVIDGEVGIEEVHDQWSMANDQSIYNLAGQRLSKLQKGLNIVNGRKVLVK